MSSVMVTNIPEKFTVEQLFQLLEHANIPIANRAVKIVKSNRTSRDQSSGRYCILSFDSDAVATTAITAINQIVLTVNNQEVSIHAMKFIPNFKTLSQDPQRNIVITNLPNELSNQDLVEIFQDFGEILSAFVCKSQKDLKDAKEKPGRGYILFKDDNSATQAIKEANGKYLGPNQIRIASYQSVEERLKNNKEVILLSAGSSNLFPTAKDAKEHLEKEYPYLKLEGDITIIDDPRPDTINCGGAAWIFTCENADMAKRLIEDINKEKMKFDTVTTEVEAFPKLTKGLLAKEKAKQKDENHKKYCDSGACIQVYNLSTDSTTEQIENFFKTYGEIKEFSLPKPNLTVQADLYHCNILFTTKEEAEKALSNGAKDEENLSSRIAIEGQTLRIVKFTEKSNVKSNTQRAPEIKQAAPQDPQ